MRSAQIARSVTLAVMVLFGSGACGASPGASAPPAPPAGAAASAAAGSPTATIGVTASAVATGTASPTASATVSLPPETPTASAAPETPSVAPAASGVLTIIDFGGVYADTATVPNCRARDALGNCLISTHQTSVGSFCTRVPGSPHALRFFVGSPDSTGETIDLLIDDTRRAPPVATKFAIRLPGAAPLHDVVVRRGDLTKLDVLDGGDHASFHVEAKAANGDLLTAAITCNAINP